MKTIDIESIPRGKGTDPTLQGAAAMDPMLARKRALEQLDSSIKGRKNRFYFACCMVVVVALSWYVIELYHEKQDLKAQDEAFQAIYDFESNAYDKALKGDETHKGLLAISEAYPHTKTGRLARVYAGLIYMHQKEYAKAINCLAQCHVGDSVLQARVWCVLGDAYSGQKNFRRAADCYTKAAQHKPNSVYTPVYLKRAAIAFEVTEQYAQAQACYQKIIEKYPHAGSAYESAVKEASRLSGRG